MYYYSHYFLLPIVSFQINLDFFIAYILLPSAAVILLLVLVFTKWAVHQQAGILVSQPPELGLPANKSIIPYKSYALTPLADYKVTGRILGKKFYDGEKNFHISPLDLVLAWQKMSDTAVLKDCKIELAGRMYSWSTDKSNLSTDEVRPYLDNNHIIPSTPEIENRLKKARIGQIVYLEGILVCADGRDGYKWCSSLNIGSTGGVESCKIIYVKKFEVVG